MMHSTNGLLTLVCLVWTTLVSATDEVKEYYLDNGLKLIVKEDHRAPVVVSQVWYKVGSSYEHLGITGTSHVLEHMMFKGTKNLGAGEFSRLIARQGGQENAFTGQDFTGYYQRLEASRLEISFRLESDRMHQLLLSAAEFKKELEVVKEERRLRVEDKPHSRVSEVFRAAAFLYSPYSAPIIGWMNDLEHMTVGDLQQWYQRWYAPNNATVVVVGDVQAAAVLALAKQYFGPIPRVDFPPLKVQKEPEQLGLKRVYVKVPAKLPYVLMGYKVPVINTATEVWEPYALEVLTGILDGGESARFSKELVRGAAVINSISTSYSASERLDTLLSFGAVPTQDHTVAEVETALKAQIQRLQDELVSAQELNRVKAQVLASDVFERDSIFYQGMKMGILETTGVGWRVLESYIAQIKAVTPEQIQAVAKKYLIEDRLTIAEMIPQPITQQRQRQVKSTGRH